MSRLGPARILIERLLRSVSARERLVGSAHVLVRRALLVDGGLARVALAAVRVGVVLVDLGRVRVRKSCALVGAGGAHMRVGGILARRRDRIRIHDAAIPDLPAG